MKQYVVTTYDYTGDGALERRMSVRPKHFEGARTLKENKHFIFGGAILDDNNRMIGSIMVVQFENEDELTQWQRTKPYITQKVWEHYEIKPFKVAEV